MTWLRKLLSKDLIKNMAPVGEVVTTGCYPVFVACEDLKQGDLVELNPASGRVRKLRTKKNKKKPLHSQGLGLKT